MTDDIAGRAAHHRITEADADTLRTRVRSAIGDMNRAAWEIGAALYALSQDSGHVKRWGYHHWQDWAREELGLQRRTTQYLLSAYTWFAVQHPLGQADRDRLLRLPWTKWRVLKGIVTAANAPGWLELAEQKSRRKLEVYVRKQFQDDCDDLDGEETLRSASRERRRRRMLDPRFADAVATIERIIAVAKKSASVNEVQDALRAELDIESSGHQQSFLKALETLVGCKIIVQVAPPTHR